MDTVLDSQIEDVFIYLTYLNERNKAQKAQNEYEKTLKKKR